MIKIILKENENGYDEVGKAVDKFIEKYGIGNVIVKLALRYTPEERYDFSNELLLYEGDNKFVWENDWWEGQKYIAIVAIDFVANVRISSCRLWEIQREDNATEEQYQKALKYLKENKE